MKTMIENSRIFQFGAMILAVLVVIASASAAQDAPPGTHDGTVVSISGDTLVMTNDEGQEHSHTLTADVKVTLDGTAFKAADLKKGTKIRVTTQGTDTKWVSRIEAIDMNLAFARSNQHDGRFVSLTGDKLVMTNAEGQEHSHQLSSDATATLDGKSFKITDLKKGTKIRVTTQRANANVASRVEAIDKNLEFASNQLDGKILSMDGAKLVMTNLQGQDDRACLLRPRTKVTCDSKVCQPTDLKPGMKVRVTLDSEDLQSAARIEAIDKNLEFATAQHDGKFLSIIGNKLIMTSLLSNREHECTLTENVKVSCDGKVCKSSDLKPGMKIRVTTDSNDSHRAIRIEAIEKNLEFASL